MPLDPPGQNEDVACDEHAEGDKEEPPSMSTQFLVPRDVLRLESEVSIKKNRLVKAKDNDPGKEHPR